MVNPAFARYIGIDYSGAQTPKSSLKGLRVYEADRLTAPQEVEPPPSPRKYWTRRGVAQFLIERLSDGSPFIASHPSRTIRGKRVNAAIGSAHVTLQIALMTNPAKAINARYPQTEDSV